MEPDIKIILSRQQLLLNKDGAVIKEYSVSTARNGAGERMDSECTPRGWHRIRARIGAGSPTGSVFVGRRPTGEIYNEQLARDFPDRDWILTRILWLCGNETGVNRSGNVDSMRRFIYIHGCPDTAVMGEPASHGCIRMTNSDIEDLFDRVPTGATVFIEE